MNSKTLNLSKYINLLFIIILLTLTSCSGEEQQSKSDETNSNKNVTTTAKGDKVIVYYFHTAYRCKTCNSFEIITKNILNQYYSNQQKNGGIIFKVINVDDKENEHFVSDYSLVTKSLVLSFQENKTEKEWKNLDKIWMLIRNETEFKDYVRKNIEEYVKLIRNNDG